MCAWRSGYSQVELVSDKWVFQSFDLDASLWVSVDVKLGDVWLKWRVDFGHNGIPYPSDAHPFPQFTLLLNENTRGQQFDEITPCCFYHTTHITFSDMQPLHLKTLINLLQNVKNMLHKTRILKTRVCNDWVKLPTFFTATLIFWSSASRLSIGHGMCSRINPMPFDLCTWTHTSAHKFTWHFEHKKHYMHIAVT